jgi:hypothetical protein
MAAAADDQAYEAAMAADQRILPMAPQVDAATGVHAQTLSDAECAAQPTPAPPP